MSKRSNILSTIPFAALLIGLTNSCSPENADINVFNDPIKIDTGYISGTVIGDVGKEVHIYRGIPYAAPPVGDLRWKPPQPMETWTGIRECTVFGNSSPQNIDEISPRRPLSEDCLYLNVLTPARKSSEALPVMVWMHGGGYETGSGKGPVCNLPRLPQNGVVLVTVNMRLGPLGLLAHPLLSQESPNGISGNYLFFDLIAALQWVQRNIAIFGGNPDNVTIFGASGGGMKVGCLLASPLTKGFFHRAIFQSGLPYPDTPLKELELRGNKFFAKLGVENDPDPLKSARALPWEKIIEVEASLSKELNMKDYGLWDSAVDGHFLTDTALNIFEAGKFNPMPIIACANLGELTEPEEMAMPYLIPSFSSVLNNFNKAGQNGYACIFNHVPKNWKEAGCVSLHSMEQLYVFGDWDNTSGFWRDYFYSWERVGVKIADTPDPGLTEIDRKVSENMMAIWAQFARTGNSSIDGLVNWPAYDSDTDQYLYIGESLEVKSGFSKIAQKQ